MNPDVSGNSKKRTTTWLLSLLAVAMFGFGFAMVPLYNLLCQVTGVQSIALRQNNQADSPVLPALEQKGRQVTVKFDTSVHPDLPWNFQAQQTKIEVRTGQVYEVMFLAHNRSSDQVTGQAIPSVVPWQATPFFSKLECFCFNRQMLTGGETTEMPLRFMVSADLPDGINSLTLSYSFMRLDGAVEIEKPGGLVNAPTNNTSHPQG